MALSSYLVSTLKLGAAPFLWAVHFAGIYAAVALACERGWAEIRWLGGYAVEWLVALATVAAAGLLIVLILHLLRHRRQHPVNEVGGFVDWLSAAACGLSLIAVTWEGVAIFWMAPCELAGFPLPP